MGKLVLYFNDEDQIPQLVRVGLEALKNEKPARTMMGVRVMREQEGELVISLVWNKNRDSVTVRANN